MLRGFSSRILLLPLSIFAATSAALSYKNIRLSDGGAPNRGRLEVRDRNGSWGAVCYRTTIPGRNLRKIGCRTLSMRGDTIWLSFPLALKQKFDKVLLVEHCHGNETSLFDCQHTFNRTSWPKNYCVEEMMCGIYPSVFIAFSNITNHSSVAAKSLPPETVLGEDINTCFYTKKERDPWFMAVLTKYVFIHTVVAFFNRNLYNTTDLNHTSIQTQNSISVRSILCIELDRKKMEYTVRCALEDKTDAVMVTLRAHNITLSLCRLDVFAIDSWRNFHGAEYKLWDSWKTTKEPREILKAYDKYNTKADELIIYPRLAVGRVDLFGLYRTTINRAYVIPTEDGVYTLLMACSSECEAWLRRSEVPGLDDEGTNDKLVVKIKYPTVIGTYDPSSTTQSNKVTLSRCHLYDITSYLQMNTEINHLSVGVRYPRQNNDDAYPFPVNMTYWQRPGYRMFHFKILNNIETSIELGSQLKVNASYKFCCKGMICPQCPLSLKLHMLKEEILINSKVEMDCVERFTTQVIDVVAQPADYNVKTIIAFPDDIIAWTKERIIIKSIRVTASTIYNCSFIYGLCPEWRLTGHGLGWNLTDGFLYLADESTEASVESSYLPWKSVYQSIQLCLKFSYLLPQISDNALKVYLLGLREDLIWNAQGFHGDEWKSAQVPFLASQKFKLRFQGSSVSKSNISIAITGVEISTEECTVHPSIAKPGFKCDNNQFRCDNGYCTEPFRRCNGVKDGCLDGSDERGCVCSTGFFTCENGQCVSHYDLCDGKRDCETGEDEKNCGFRCSGGYECYEGSCIPATKMCSVAGGCGDSSSLPYVCGSCSNGNTTCKRRFPASSGKYQHCGTLEGICNFETGQCGFEFNENSTAEWQVVIPQSLRNPANLIPRTDHTTITPNGAYTLLRAVNKHGGVASMRKAILEDNIQLCVRFWFQIMDTTNNSLEVFMATNGILHRLWNASDTATSHWSYGQVEVPESYQNRSLIFVGEITSSGSDYVALDDIELIANASNCQYISSQENPSCYFSNGICGWKIDGRWSLPPKETMTTQHVRLVSAWPYLALTGEGSNWYSNFTSPTVDLRVWKCLRFWMFSGTSYFKRRLNVNYIIRNITRQIWSLSQLTPHWKFVQLDLLTDRVDAIKVEFQGVKSDRRVNLFIDDISFSKENCKRVPVLGYECQNYEILDATDRRVNLIVDSNMLCDAQLDKSSWYRITGAAGNQIPTKCVSSPGYHCSAVNRGWINGSHPDVEDGIVTRDVCFSYAWRGRPLECCRIETEVKIRNCSGFYVYKFIGIYYQTFCWSRYCSIYNPDIKNFTSREIWRGWKNIGSTNKWLIRSRINTTIPFVRSANQTNEDICVTIKGSYSPEIVQFPLAKTLTELTLCHWMTFSNPLVWYIKYKWSKNVTTFAKEVLLRSDMWHHMCFTWKSSFGEWRIYRDGTILRYGVGEWDTRRLLYGNSLQVVIAWTSLTNQTASKQIISITNMNVWSKVINEEEIFYQSHSCSTLMLGDVFSWEAYAKIFNAISITRCACHGKTENVLAVQNSDHSETATAIFSPQYERSSSYPRRCLRFLYKIWGPGAISLTILQELNNTAFPLIPLWVVEDNSISVWREGKVALTAVMGYKIVLNGITTQGHGTIAIGGLYTTDEPCDITPSHASKACNEVLRSQSGYILSPYYPGYYGNNASCKWEIVGVRGHVIKIEIQEFELEESPSCDADYLEIWEHRKSGSNRIGRYCGTRYPESIDSKQNLVTVIFSTNSNTTRTGFRAFYRVLKNTIPDDYCVQDCPSGCQCRQEMQGVIVESQQLLSVPKWLPNDVFAISFSGSKIYILRRETFIDFPKLQHIDLSNNHIIEVQDNAFVNLTELQTLRLNTNFIKAISSSFFQGLPNLRELDIGRNFLTLVKKSTFRKLPNLRVLGLRQNKLQGLAEGTLDKNRELTFLYLHDNKIERIVRSTFKRLANLRKLTLHNNQLKEKNIPQDVFQDLTNLQYLSLDSFILCCYAIKTIPGLNCVSPGNQFSSCEEMLKNFAIKLCIWLLGALACLGNLCVIIWWTRVNRRDNKAKSTDQQKEKRGIQAFLLCNLAVADFLMGVYLIIVAIHNVKWSGEYFRHDVGWRSGLTCQFAGAISTLSGEVSIMVLLAITADRANSILLDFSARRLSFKTAKVICLVIWCIGIIMSFAPLLVPSYFTDDLTGFTFYGRSTVCLPLQISADRPAGWQYSVAIFIIFNGIAFVFILISYIAIFLKVKRSSQSARSSLKRDSALAKRVLFVILTDFCCWMPVIILGVLSLTGSFHDTSGQAYAWIAVFVLPVNSSINPFLYTFSSPQVLQRLKVILQRMKNRERGGQSTSSDKRIIETSTNTASSSVIKTNVSDTVTRQFSYSNRAFNTKL